jgi:hypothetical protein
MSSFLAKVANGPSWQCLGSGGNQVTTGNPRMHANVLPSNNTILHVVPAAVGNSLSFVMVQGTCHAMSLTNTRRYNSRFWLESFSDPG